MIEYIKTYEDALIAADWVEERGGNPVSWRMPWMYDVDGYDLSYGHIYEYEYGDGDGYGEGNRFGYGYGELLEDGRGDGKGYDDGYGYGYGGGYGEKHKLKERVMPTVGKRQMVFFGRSFVFVGDVVRQTSQFGFELENASMLCRTNGVPWDVLADGERRNEATFRYWGTVSVGPDFGPCREWVGELPTKEVNG